MKKYILFIFLFIPFICFGQATGALKKNITTKHIWGEWNEAGVIKKDSLLATNGVGVEGYVPVFKSALGKSVFVNPSTFTPTNSVTTNTNQSSGLTGNKTWSGAHLFNGSFSLGDGSFATLLSPSASNQTIVFPALSGKVPIFSATPASGGLVSWSGTLGALTNYSFPSSGSFGYWSRTGTTISTATSNDNVTIGGNLTMNATPVLSTAGSANMQFKSGTTAGESGVILYDQNVTKWQIYKAGTTHNLLFQNLALGLTALTVDVATNDATFTKSVNVVYGSGIPFNIFDGSGFGMYLANQNTLNTNYGINSSADFYINFRGYQNGTTQFRNTFIADGKGNTVAAFTGSGLGVKFPILAGTGTRMVVSDNLGNISTQAIPSGGGGGTVATVSVNSSNGFAGTSSGGANPALTISTSVTGTVLSGNGTSISAAATTGSGTTVVLSTNPTLAGMTANGVVSIPTAGYFTGNVTNGIRFNNAADTKTHVTFKDAGGITLGDASYLNADATTGFRVNNAANTFNNLLVADNGNATVRGTIGASNLSGTNTGDQNLAPYATLASPALTGNPTAPTQSQGDNSTKLATTAYVNNAEKQLAAYYADATNSGSTETDLYSYSVPGSTLVNNGDKISFSYSGYYAGNSNSKTLQIIFGGSIFTFAPSTNAGGYWKIDGYVIKTGSTTYRIGADRIDTTPSNSIYAQAGSVTNFTSSNTLKITGTGSSTSDITAKVGTVEFKPAP
jgi:hypothetical protein